MVKFWVLVVFLINSCQVFSQNEFEFKTALDHDNTVRLEWDFVRNESDYILFKVTILKRRLPLIFGFGFSDYGEFENADFFVMDISKNGVINTVDAYTNKYGVLFKDKKSNYDFVDMIQPKINKLNEIVILFGRKIDTCDVYDYYIDSGTTHILHFILDKSYRRLEGLFVSDDFNPETSSDSNDMTRVQLLKSNAISNEFKQTVLETSPYFEIRNDNVKIPADDTTYWCLVHKLNDTFKSMHHIVAFEGVIDDRNIGVVHHMELFHCAFDPTEDAKGFNGICTSEEKPAGLKQCRNVVAAWAMGADVFIYPDHVGGVIGGKDKSMYLVLEIHYDNQKRRNDIIDSSGIKIYYTKNLREFDGGIMEIGLEYNAKNSIPPQVNKFNLNGYCLSDCTRVGLPQPDGITVFASQLHTHLTGRKVWTSIIRKNKIVEILNSDYHYSPMFQEIRMLENPVKVLPGDTIINTCEYNTKLRKNMTFGGYGIRDEMCVNYVHYYPVAEIEVCKTSIRDDILNEFFIKMKELDLANTSAENSLEKNFNSIRWTPLTTAILNKLYSKAPISFSCNSSDSENILEKNGFDMSQYRGIELPEHDYEQSKRVCSKQDLDYDY